MERKYLTALGEIMIPSAITAVVATANLKIIVLLVIANPRADLPQPNMSPSAESGNSKNRRSGMRRNALSYQRVRDVVPHQKKPGLRSRP
jgi:hypothetical protein